MRELECSASVLLEAIIKFMCTRLTMMIPELIFGVLNLIRTGLKKYEKVKTRKEKNIIRGP